MKNLIFVFTVALSLNGCFSFLPYQTDFSFPTKPTGTIDKNAMLNHAESMNEANQPNEDEKIAVVGLYEQKFNEVKRDLVMKNEEIKELEKRCNKNKTSFECEGAF
jgi:hypothetical protein